MTEKVEHTALRKLAEAATPGPWRHDISYDWPSKVRSEHPDHMNRWVVDVPSFPSKEFTIADAAFIAAANPKTVLALLAERDRLREALKPFDWLVDSYKALPDNHQAFVNVGDLRRARAVLKDTNQ